MTASGVAELACLASSIPMAGLGLTSRVGGRKPCPSCMIELARSTHFLVEKLDSGKVFAAEPSICTEVNGVPICFKLDESLAKKVLSAFGIDASKLLRETGITVSHVPFGPADLCKRTTSF